MPEGSADRDGSAASSSEARKRNHYARVGQVSCDERSHKLFILAVESFGRLGKKVANSSTSWWRASSEERTGGPYAEKVFVRSTFSRLYR